MKTFNGKAIYNPSEKASNANNYWAKMHVIDLPFAMQDLVRFCLGDFISSGQYRMVFEWDLRPETVVKFVGVLIY